mgnify:FL=1
MITHFRNRAIKRFGLSFVFFFLFPFAIATINLGVPQIIGVIAAVILGTFFFVFYIQANIALAEAKGYDSAIVPGMIILACICFGWIFFVIPVALIGLKDKTKTRRRLQSEESEPTKRNPLAKLPPLRE